MVIDMQENKITAGIFSYVMTINIVAAYSTTGAFEIYINDELKFSRFDTNKLPSAKKLNEIFADANI